MTTTFFPDAHDVQFGKQNFNVVQNVYSSSSSLGEPLKELASRIAAAAIHDSAERCDAPKCDPETRVAVQDDLYSWIVDGDGESEHPRNVKWVTGPAGSGKTAIMGSLAVRCAANGLLGGTFFFASWSASIGRRRKTAFVTTIAHQLAMHREDLKNAISTGMEKNPGIFEKNLQVQMDVLVLAPLREVVGQFDGQGPWGAIIVDGLDECEAEQYHDTTSPGRRDKPVRTNAEDQLEILQVLQAASSDPLFPFRILIASRPERVFREFFDPENNPTLLAQKLDLHEEYNADADITLFLEARFSQLRRRYGLPLSWPPPGAIETLVKNASGQFIYAATVIRFLDMGHREPLKVLLEAILKMEAKGDSNPLKQLDNLYSHILESSPDPRLSVLWIRSIQELNSKVGWVSALNVHLLLQMDPESNEAEHLLGNLHSLIRIPPLSKHANTKYDFYHKSLFDFLQDPDRCGKLHFQDGENVGFIWDSIVQTCTRGCDTQFSYPENFLKFLVALPNFIDVSIGSAYSKALPTLPGADWWVSLTVAHKENMPLQEMFRGVHEACPWYHCKPGCRIWRRSLMRHFGMDTWTGVWFPLRRKGFRLVTLDEAFERSVCKVIPQ